MVWSILVCKLRRETDFLSDECIPYFLLKCVVTQATSAPKPFTFPYITGVLISPLARPGRKRATATEDFDVYTGCPRRNVPDFGRVFLMLKYTDITQNTYVQSWTVTEMMGREKCSLLTGPRTVPVSWQPNLCYGVECGIILRQFSSGQP